MTENMILSADLNKYHSITFNFRLIGYQNDESKTKDIYLTGDSKAYIYISNFDESDNITQIGDIPTKIWNELKWSDLTGSYCLHTYVTEEEFNHVLSGVISGNNGIFSKSRCFILVDDYLSANFMGLKYSFASGTILPSNGNENEIKIQQNYCQIFPYASSLQTSNWYSGTRYKFNLDSDIKKICYNYNRAPFLVYTKKNEFEVTAHRIGHVNVIEGIKGVAKKQNPTYLLENGKITTPLADMDNILKYSLYREGYENNSYYKNCLGFKPEDADSDGMLSKAETIDMLFKGWSGNTSSNVGLVPSILFSQNYDPSKLFMRSSHMKQPGFLRITNNDSFLKLSDIYGPESASLMNQYGLVASRWYPGDTISNTLYSLTNGSNPIIIEDEIEIKNNTINVSNNTLKSFVGLHQVGDKNYTILKSSFALGTAIAEDDILGNENSTQQMHDVTLGLCTLLTGDTCSNDTTFCGGGLGGGDGNICTNLGASDNCPCDRTVSDCKLFNICAKNISCTCDLISDGGGETCSDDTGDSCSDDTGEVQPQYPSSSDVTFISSGGPMSVYLSPSTALNESFYIKFGDDEKKFLANYTSLTLTPNKTYNNNNEILKNCKPVYFIPDNVWEQYAGQTISIGQYDLYDDKLDINLVYKENKLDSSQKSLSITTVGASNVYCANFSKSGSSEFKITGDKWESVFSTIKFDKDVNIYIEEFGVLYPIAWCTTEINANNIISRDTNVYIEPTSYATITVHYYDSGESDAADIIGVFTTNVNTSATTLITYINKNNEKEITLPRSANYKIWFSPIAGMTQYAHQQAIHQYFMDIVSESNARRKKENVIWNGETMSNSSLNDNNSFFINELLGSMSGNNFVFNLKIKNYENGYRYCAIVPIRDTSNNAEELVLTTPNRNRTYALYAVDGKLSYYDGVDFSNYGVVLASLYGGLDNPNAILYPASVQWLGSNNQIVTKQMYKTSVTIKNWAHLCNGHDGSGVGETYALIVTNGTNIPI